LRSRENTDLVNVYDVGTPIDQYIQPLLAAMDSAEIERTSFGWYSTTDGRFWLVLGQQIFVFSYFPGSKVSAWSTYTTEGWRDDITTWQSGVIPAWHAIKDGKLFLLSYKEFSVLDPDYEASQQARMLAVFPGGAEYSNSTAVIVLPFIDAKMPATKKIFTALDVIGEGTWRVEACDGPNLDLTLKANYTLLSSAITFTTTNLNRIPLSFRSTHLLLRFTKVDRLPGVIGKVIVHYNQGAAT
jgi:hypothetical protein